MLNITLICVGKIKEKFYCGAIDRVQKTSQQILQA